MNPFERYTVQWRGYILDGSENEGNVINESNVLEFRFRNKSYLYNVYINGILLEPGDEFYERLQCEEQTFGDYEIRWEKVNPAAASSVAALSVSSATGTALGDATVAARPAPYQKLIVMIKTWVKNGN